MERLLRVREVAERLGCSRAWVYELVKRQEIPSVRFGKNMVRIREQDFETWLKRSESK